MIDFIVSSFLSWGYLPIIADGIDTVFLPVVFSTVAWHFLFGPFLVFFIWEISGCGLWVLKKRGPLYLVCLFLWSGLVSVVVAQGILRKGSVQRPPFFALDFVIFVMFSSIFCSFNVLTEKDVFLWTIWFLWTMCPL